MFASVVAYLIGVMTIIFSLTVIIVCMQIIFKFIWTILDGLVMLSSIIFKKLFK